MLTINTDRSISLTRGDAVSFEIGATTGMGETYMFQTGDVVRFKVFEKNRCDSIILVKDTVVNEESEMVLVQLNSEDTKIGGIIHKPADYWYEVELNPNTTPQTIIGYDISGPKLFRLFPEGDDT